MAVIASKKIANEGCKYLGVPYSTMDCQKFWERVLRDCGINKDLGGSNSWYRYIMQHGWCGTPEECKEKYGCIPQGATLFIWAPVDDKTPEQFRHDGIGDLKHMGIYTAMTGSEMVNIAIEAGDEKASKYNYGDGAIHSSESRGGVCTSKFAGKTIPNGGWNRVGLWLEAIDYSGIEPGPTPPEPPTPPSPFPYEAMVIADNVNTRKEPSSQSKQSRVGKLNCGDVVQVDETTVNSKGEDWSKCEYTDRSGAHWQNFWIISKYLQKIDPEPGPEPSGDLYTVHIPYLTKDQAEALVKQYPGSWMTKDEAVG